MLIIQIIVFLEINILVSFTCHYIMLTLLFVKLKVCSDISLLKNREQILD